MTWPATLPGAALRSLRTAAGRRALHLVLLVGGLCALGFLCGGQASAADGLPTTTVKSGTVAAAPTKTKATSIKSAPALPAVPANSTVPTGRRDTSLSAGPENDVVEDVVGAVDGAVLRPVGDLVETVTGELAQPHAEMPPLPSLPSLPAPELPDAPDLPHAPELPDAPGLPELPGLPSLPSGSELPGQTPPVTAAPASKSPVVGTRAGDDSGKAAATATARFAGPRSVTASPAAGTATRSGGHPAVRGAHVPVPQAPGDDTDGQLGHRSVADGGSSRHGDAQAVSLNHRAAVRLVAGAADRAEAFETRDRYRDVPVSPA
ncbi:hypothetical protein [Streptomyces sp. NPDC020489]|uniref:hypothetical protein n=1 Tax=Streptomyces sp. NPDC020489 TaxID=3365077 RepID=UPI00378FBD98